jgi:hypothetical protein
MVTGGGLVVATAAIRPGWIMSKRMQLTSRVPSVSNAVLLEFRVIIRT